MSYNQEELLSLYAESRGDDPEKVKALTPKTDTEGETSIEDLYNMAQERVASIKVQKPTPEKYFVERVFGGPLQRSGERLSAMGGRIMNTLESYGPEATRASVEAYAAGLPQPDSGFRYSLK